MTGAHPDDEWSGFLAWLAFGRGVHTVYACATRGEGGQNALGPERGAALAALRGREMARAAGELELTLRWLDPAFADFGYSRSAEDTLRRWGEARLVECLVRLILAERPDALSPTFLDVPGQHGHHRAITRCTLEAAALAADAGYRLPEAEAGVWRVGKIYLPAFPGTGGSYDDAEPPPPETIRVDLGEICGPLGASWARIGERSRRHHATARKWGAIFPTGHARFRCICSPAWPTQAGRWTGCRTGSRSWTTPRGCATPMPRLPTPSRRSRSARGRPPRWTPRTPRCQE